MNKIIKVNEAIQIAQKLKKQDKTIVLVGGFFDILHVGHIKFLESSKKQGDYLLILLEDDAKARKIKGLKRPINSQTDRAKILSALEAVDYVVLLKNMTKDARYDKIILQIAPSVIATTYGDPYIKHKRRQAKLVKGKVMFVTKRIHSHSTTQLAESL